MKRLSVFLLGAVALFVNACEKHPVSRLPGEHAMQFEKYLPAHGGTHHGADTHAPKAAASHAPAAPPAETAKPAAEAKPGEAPKFFPEKK